MHEDEFLFVLNKPPGIHTEAQEKGSPNSIAANLPELFLCHRLDFETSGVLVAAKTKDIWEELRALFREGKVKKTYLALLEGICPERFTIDAAIGSPYRHSKKVRTYTGRIPPRALPAKTTFKRIRIAEEISSVEVSMKTGRRHQVRVHASLAGYPLVGDTLYGAKTSLPNSTEGFFLHASRVAFEFRGKSFTFSAPLSSEYSHWF